MVTMSGGFLGQLQALADPVQRQWLWGRLRNRWTAVPKSAPPAYLQCIPAAERPGQVTFHELSPEKTATVVLTLPGDETLRVTAGKADGLIDRKWDDPAAAEAFQGFAWTGQDPFGVALATLWPVWLDRYAEVDRSSLAWTPDIVAERAIALLDGARTIGLPAPRAKTLAVLATHAAVLLDSFTDPFAQPSALARRAHALIRLGLDLAMPATGHFGLTALLAECDRLLLPSGIGNMESTHFHLRLCQSLADAWLTALRHDRAEAGALEQVLRRALAVVPLITLPGGLPLIGDVAETLPVGWLTGLLRGAPIDQGWAARLTITERNRLETLRDQCLYPDLEALRADGWLRVDQEGWSGLWHAAPSGWPAFDGHGHQDLGACELHFGEVPVFVDPGGGPDGDVNGRGLCQKATAHGGLQLNHHDPYPLNHPDYSDNFRLQIGGSPLRLQAEYDGASLLFGTVAGIGGLREGSRHWHFAEGGIIIDDMLNGTGRYLVSRRFLTPLSVHKEDPQTVLLEGSNHRFRMVADQPLTITKGLRWKGFGTTEMLHVIEIDQQANLPWRGRIRVRPV
jgi:hypothetical protein